MKAIVRCTNLRFTFSANALLYGSYSVCKMVNFWVIGTEVRAGMLGYPRWDKPTPNWDDLGIHGEGVGRVE